MRITTLLTLGAGLLGSAALGLVSCAPQPPPGRGIFVEEIPLDARHPEGVLNPTIEIKPWTFAGRTGKVISTPHFRLHTTLADSILLDRLPGFLEMALAQYLHAFGELDPPEGELQTFVVANRQQWEALTHRVAGLNAPIYLRIQRGGFAASGRGVFWDIGTQDTLMIAAHEGWHQFTQATFVQPLPLWLEEGLGTYMEGFRWHPEQRDLPVFLPWANTERFDVLRERVARNDIMSLRTLLNSRPQDLIESSDADTLTYYAQVWALAHFLRDEYPAQLEQCLSDAQDGAFGARVAERTDPRAASVAVSRRVGDAPFRAYFSDDLDRVGDEYEDYIREIVRPGGRDAIVAGLSPRSAPKTP